MLCEFHKASYQYTPATSRGWLLLWLYCIMPQSKSLGFAAITWLICNHQVASSKLAASTLAFDFARIRVHEMFTSREHKKSLNKAGVHSMMLFTQRERRHTLNGAKMLTQFPPEGHEARLVDEALTALRDGSGLDANLITIVPTSARDRGFDAEIDIIVGDSARRYLVECKTTVDRREHARKIKHQLEAMPETGLLITTYLSREIARYCREIDLQFIDTHGNAYLKGPGMLVYVAGERHERGIQPTRSSGSVTGLAGLRIAFALLSRANMVAAPYREIASTAGVSLGAVSNALEDLERRGYVIEGTGPSRRRLLEPQRLFDEWALNYPIQLRPKLNARRYSVPNPDWWMDMQLERSGAVWSGDVAAKRLTQYLKPATQTVYVEPSERSAWMKELVTSYRAKPDPKGSLEVLDKFWGVSLDQKPGIAPAVLVYADLLASLDPRAEEAAQLIRKDWINESFDPA